MVGEIVSGIRLLPLAVNSLFAGVASIFITIIMPSYRILVSTNGLYENHFPYAAPLSHTTNANDDFSQLSADHPSFFCSIIRANHSL